MLRREKMRRETDMETGWKEEEEEELLEYHQWESLGDSDDAAPIGGRKAQCNKTARHDPVDVKTLCVCASTSRPTIQT